jgi:hypothetical protein
LETYFERAEEMLRPAVYPEHLPPLAKFKALEQSARGLQLPFARLPMLVNFEQLPGGLNHVGGNTRRVRRLRRLHHWMQLRREEHHSDELSARCQAARRGDFYRCLSK